MHFTPCCLFPQVFWFHRTWFPDHTCITARVVLLMVPVSLQAWWLQCWGRHVKEGSLTWKTCVLPACLTQGLGWDPAKTGNGLPLREVNSTCQLQFVAYWQLFVLFLINTSSWHPVCLSGVLTFLQILQRESCVEKRHPQFMLLLFVRLDATAKIKQNKSWINLCVCWWICTRIQTF